MNFKALTLLAGASNPNREQYETQLKLFCGKHALNCKDTGWIGQVAADMMAGADVAPKLVELRRVAAESPAQIYNELMLHMTAVDAGILSRFDPSLDLVEVTDEQAKGTAKQADGRVSEFSFVRTATGWLLKVR